MSITQDEEAGHEIGPGKYYDRMVFTAVDERTMPPYGGDCNGLIWREDDTDKWVLTFRTRHYAGPNSNPFTGGDTKTFKTYYGELEVLRKACDEIPRIAAEIVHGKVLLHSVLKIEGDCKKFEDIVVNHPPEWMHTKKEKRRVKGPHA